MPDLRVVIVDDEPIARRALRRMLADFHDIRICGEAESVDEAERLVADVRAEAVFLDIELYGESGFDLVPRLDKDTAVVFVTAYDQYAIRAFEVNALDYLLKPVVKNRLTDCIRRLRNRRVLRPSSTTAELLNPDDVVLVQDGKRRCWMTLKTVCLIEANGDYSMLKSTDGVSGVVWRSLRQWEKLLPRDRFMRIHRGMIVNLDHIRAFKTVPGGRIKLHIESMAEPCIASRRFTPQLRIRLALLSG